MMSLPSFTASHAHPEPNLAAPAALNLVFISSTLPNAESIADLTSEVGPLVLDGFVIPCSSRVKMTKYSELTPNHADLDHAPSKRRSGSNVHLHYSCKINLIIATVCIRWQQGLIPDRTDLTAVAASLGILDVPTDSFNVTRPSSLSSGNLST